MSFGDNRLMWPMTHRRPFSGTSRSTSDNRSSKYPPAKPGALRCEPLKAAYPGGFGAVSHLLRGMRHQVPKLTILITCASGCTPICRGVIFASSSIDGAPLRVLGGPRIQSFIDGRGSDFGK